MKNILLLLFVALFTFNSYGQGKSISAEEYNSALEKSRTKSFALPSRSNKIFKRYDGKEVVREDLTISEFLSENKLKITTISKQGNNTEKTETIHIGNFMYERVNNGKWEKTDLRNPTGKFKIGSENVKSEKKFFYEEAKSGTEFFKIYTQETVFTMETVKSYFVEKTYIGKDELIKKVTTQGSNDNPENISLRSETSYEYNPKDIKIIAPIKSRRN